MVSDVYTVHAKGVVEPTVGRIDLFDDLSGRDDPQHAVVAAVVGFVKIHATACRIASDVSVITFQPADLVEHGFVGDVGGVVGVVGVGRRDVDHGKVGGPFGSNLEQKVGG